MYVQREIQYGPQLYHVTPIANLPAIMQRGLYPRLGPNASMQGEDQLAIHAYVTAQDVRDAVAYGGEYRRLVQATHGVDVELCVLQILSRPFVTVSMYDGALPSARLVLPIPPSCLIPLDTNLHPIRPDVLCFLKMGTAY